MQTLSIGDLCAEAKLFSENESYHSEPSLYGSTDGKAIGTYLEHKFRDHLLGKKYAFTTGNSASGIDFPGLDVDIKVTSIRQPQSSSPFRSARQKIYGLGYSLIVFVYHKTDDDLTKTSKLQILHTVFVDKSCTGDFQLTKGLRHILDNQGNSDDLTAFMTEKNLPVEEIEMNNLAQELLQHRPNQGYLTISNALQWRLQYTRVIEQAGIVTGVDSIHKEAHQ